MQVSLDHPLLTECELAALLNLSVFSLRKWRVQGRGPRYIKLSGAAVRYLHADIENYLESCPAGGKQ